MPASSVATGTLAAHSQVAHIMPATYKSCYTCLVCCPWHPCSSRQAGHLQATPRYPTLHQPLAGCSASASLLLRQPLAGCAMPAPSVATPRHLILRRPLSSHVQLTSLLLWQPLLGHAAPVFMLLNQPIAGCFVPAPSATGHFVPAQAALCQPRQLALDWPLTGCTTQAPYRPHLVRHCASTKATCRSHCTSHFCCCRPCMYWPLELA